MVVGMTLSYTLNAALEKRAQHSDILTVFLAYNDHRLHPFYSNVHAKFSGKKTEGCKICDRESNEEEESTYEHKTYYESEDCLKNCICKCEIDMFPELQLKFEDVVYKECLNLYLFEGELHLNEQRHAKVNMEKVEATWKNMHRAAHLIFNEMIKKFDSMEPAEFVASYDQYNDYGTMDMFSNPRSDEVSVDTTTGKLGSKFAPEHKLFLLYTFVYCTLNTGLSEYELLECFEDYESHLDFFADVKFEDFVGIVPLIKLFVIAHEEIFPHEKFQIGNDLENLFDFFLKHSFMKQVNDTGYNVYTAANVYYAARQEKNLEDRCISRRPSRRDFSTIKESTRLLSKRGQHGKASSFLKCLRKFYIVTLFMGYPRKHASEFEVEAEVESSTERACICLMVQSTLYVGALFLSTDSDVYEGSSIWLKYFLSIIVLLFSFQYLVSISISEFYINTIAMFWDSKNTQRVFIVLNVFVNSLLSLTLIYSSALILKGSESFVDIILNSVAVFFISELDDMMISNFDEEKLAERTLEALIFYLRDLSTKEKRGSLSADLKSEQVILKVLAFSALLCILPYSLFIFFA